MFWLTIIWELKKTSHGVKRCSFNFLKCSTFRGFYIPFGYFSSIFFQFSVTSNVCDLRPSALVCELEASPRKLVWVLTLKLKVSQNKSWPPSLQKKQILVKWGAKSRNFYMNIFLLRFAIDLIQIITFFFWVSTNTEKDGNKWSNYFLILWTRN